MHSNSTCRHHHREPVSVNDYQGKSSENVKMHFYPPHLGLDHDGRKQHQTDRIQARESPCSSHGGVPARRQAADQQRRHQSKGGGAITHRHQQPDYRNMSQQDVEHLSIGPLPDFNFIRLTVYR